ncbi:pyridoxamine 5'-phosphate oxidase family protein [Gordonia alkaliphila]|uniref:Pyridoxamine 5'-phosphate oxidase family protein n=1 Tax=Gordonia alkaliphila TaxID=1053547 RepID=A0ABP8Z757_9ACTN|nr:pyridoxamine 5'-phosphate oxidase family protein [Gordonia alkaliphila]MCK0440037.1 pyridoxamine 5'-phosphate oxidase family protein [Gordonia alkaliphila]
MEEITVLDEAQCWNLLSESVMGRLALSVDGEPEIFPINAYAHDGKILFRTGEGTKLSEIAVNGRVAFETDGFTSKIGWSVVAKGRARILTSTHEIMDADQLPLKPWVPTLKMNYVEIDVEEISGRRFKFGAEPDRYPV